MYSLMSLQKEIISYRYLYNESYYSIKIKMEMRKLMPQEKKKLPANTGSGT